MDRYFAMKDAKNHVLSAGRKFAAIIFETEIPKQ
jgi:hypothetical protein